MALRDDIRLGLRQVAGPVLGACLVAYFAFHVFNGDRGFRAWVQLREEVKQVELLAAQVAEDRQSWERRVHLLHPNSLDPDLLDERVRAMLNYAGEDDLIIFEQDQGK
ncbi:septum formation initiator family protein [Magnetospira sp. QH-2]|uniref:FtsB family cell division protein n=1 Tax=Magnetospira sp. (strain QH-2) TaxID=1288970 RepID=UPI0005FA0FDC|nr:septum formation initiator family protein [Magnetospira sp. QH-2]